MKFLNLQRATTPERKMIATAIAFVGTLLVAAILSRWIRSGDVCVVLGMVVCFPLAWWVVADKT